MKRLMTFALGAALTIGVVGCSKPSLDGSVSDVESRLAASAQGDFNAAVASGDAHWAKRDSEEETRAAIAAWQEAVTFDTGDADRRATLFPVYTKLAAAYYWLGHGHLFFISNRREREAAQQGAYQECMEVGRVALALRNPAWNEALQDGTHINDAVKLLEKEDVPAAYWYATCAGKWATIEGIAALLGYKDQIYAMISRVAELDESFYYRASDRYFGVVYTKLPFMNPDLPRSRAHFEAAINAHPEYLETRALFVEEHLTKTGEGRLAREQLEYVINADPNAAPNVYAENVRAQRRSKQLLDKFDEFFR